MPLSPPPAEPVLLKRTPIKAVLTIVRFPTDLGLAQPNSPRLAEFQGRLKERYPRLLPQQQVGVQLGPQGLQIGQSASWRFAAVDGRWSAILSSDFVGLEATDYRGGFIELRERLRELLGVVNDLVAPATREFYGLRYVNQIPEPPGGNWGTYVSSELLGPLATKAIGSDVVSSIQDIRVQQPDGVFSLKHGPRREGSENFYLLDLDYFSDKPVPFDVTTIDALAASYNDLSYRMFRWAITDDYFQSLRNA